MFASALMLVSIKVGTYNVPTHVLRRPSLRVRSGYLQVSVLTEESPDYRQRSYFLHDGWFLKITLKFLSSFS
jgi:hypothetical protein